MASHPKGRNLTKIHHVRRFVADVTRAVERQADVSNGGPGVGNLEVAKVLVDCARALGKLIRDVDTQEQIDALRNEVMALKQARQLRSVA